MGRPVGDEPSIGDDLSELMAIQRRLDRPTSVDERITLRDRQRELRSRWVPDFRSSSTEWLIDLGKALAAQRQDVLDRRLDIASTGNGSGEGGGLDPLATMEHNRSVDETHGRADVEERLRKVRSEIRRRRSLDHPGNAEVNP